MLTTRRGFTLIELMVALVLMGLVATSIYKVLVGNQRVYRQQAERVDLNQNLRTAIAVLPLELRELDAGDAAGSDVVFMNSTVLRYNSGRNLQFLCQAPNTATMQIILARNPWFGGRSLDATLDQIMLYAENDPSTRTDNVWLRVNPGLAVTGTACPGGAASLTVAVTGVTAAQLAGVLDGAPARGYEVVEMSLYADGAGEYWLGTRTQSKTTLGWSTLQPIAGPLTATGLQLTYYDANGAVTAVPANVARVGIAIAGRSYDQVRNTSGAIGRLTDNLVTHVALRNNPRP
jgi:prepilin-type N-terminal cleavage/methylation domain-containing protein